MKSKPLAAPVPASTERPPFPVPTLETLKTSYGYEYHHWPGGCGMVARTMRDLLRAGTVVEGKYFGPVKEGSFFDRDYRTSGDIERNPKKPKIEFWIHSWIELDRWILDPTRWVFEDVRPYIYQRPRTGRWDQEYRPLRGSRRDETS